MARLTTARKKKTVRVSRKLNSYALVPTDSWHKAKHFVHYEIDSKEWANQIRDFIRNNFDRKTVANIAKLPDWKVYSFSHWAVTAYLLKTKPEIVPEEYKTGIVAFVNKLNDEGKAIKSAEVPKVKANVYVPTIQERILEQAQDACEAIEEWLEGYVKDKKNFDPKGFDFAGHFAKFNVSQAHARKILKFYEKELEEAKAIVNKPTPQQISKIKDEREKDYAEQLREGYSHVTKKDAEKYLEALETLVGACNLVIDASKATRKPRAKKAPSKEKIVAKLKYKERDDVFQVASINPLELISSKEIWVFNTKTRKLGKYVAAEDAKVMTVKGSIIVGFDETLSVQKTLRKPEEILKQFKAAGKVKLRKFLEEINTTDTKLSGRINADTVLLKAIQ